MPRKPRMYLPGIPAHLVQRGNNKEPCFFTELDYRVYLAALGDVLERYRVRLHAYVLMTNHVHLLMTPEDTDGISRVMQHTVRLYVRHVNERYGRTGTLWEGRHKASLIDADDYLLACYRYIELNPVRAGMVRAPEEYPWSSYRWHGWGQVDDLVSDHHLYRDLAVAVPERLAAYRALFKGNVPDRFLAEMSEAVGGNYPVGNDRFKERIMLQLGRSLGHAKRGRPSLKPVMKKHEAE